MNIRDEKKKYTPPKMKLVKLHQVANLMNTSNYSEREGEDIDELDEGSDDEFG